MTPDEFITKWRASQLKERSAAQSHFIDLCRMLGEPAPTDVDLEGESYCFEKGLKKAGGEDGWADVWKRDCFAWEYKGKKAKLEDAFKQLSQYALALESPPLHIACDTSRFVIKTAWTSLTSETYEIELADLRDFGQRQRLKNCFSNPDALKPGKSRQELTEEAAATFAALAKRLRERGHDPHLVAHFVNRLVFCMFAEDVGMLGNRMFERLLDAAYAAPAQFEPMTKGLFAAMKAGGSFGVDGVPWFNGGLFDDDRTLPLEKNDIAEVRAAAKLDWSDIDPSILGTLFERGLDPDKRSQLGAHYTDRDKIMMIVRPVVIEPLEAEWAAAKVEIAAEMEKARTGKSPAARTKARNAAQKIHSDYLERLAAFRVLDPACGSGNFLYLALQSLKDLEHKANLEAEALGLQRGFPRVGPEAVKGIEINPYAAELARVSVWIGEIQWMLRNGFSHRTNPILTPLHNIECKDALINDDGTEVQWPVANVIVGNPPFLGNKRMIGDLGEDYVKLLRQAYEDTVPGGADFVTYWFAKAWGYVQSGATCRVGFVATNSIRGGASRDVLKPIVNGGRIFRAWSDEAWVVEGAAVRVSLVLFDKNLGAGGILDGIAVRRVSADLSDYDEKSDLTEAGRLSENKGISFQGISKVGQFEVDGDTARKWLRLPTNPNGRTNADVLRPWIAGIDLADRYRDFWVVDFGPSLSVEDAALYEQPFSYVQRTVQPFRQSSRHENYGSDWWIHGRPRPGMRRAIEKLEKYIVTPKVSKHRFFVYEPCSVAPSNLVIVVASDSPAVFGILHSRIHELWSLALGQWIGVGNDPTYTPTTTFETFPFPEGLTPNIPAADYAKDPRAKAIAAAAKELNEKREAWLNPPDLVDRVPEVVPGFPDRLIPKNAEAAEILKKRTLTNLYNERPAWLAHLHERLDAAVAAAYGWPVDLSDDEILARLFALNQERAKAGR
jgi:type II restriction/modification system DNA methylase subunit YeeA